MLEASCGKIVLRKKQFMEGVKWGRYLITNPEVLEMQGGMSLK